MSMPVFDAATVLQTVAFVTNWYQEYQAKIAQEEAAGEAEKGQGADAGVWQCEHPAGGVHRGVADGGGVGHFSASKKRPAYSSGEQAGLSRGPCGRVRGPPRRACFSRRSRYVPRSRSS